jgi:hypothetical protein
MLTGLSRIYPWGNSELVVDLAGGGGGNGNPVILYQAKTSGIENQLWKFVLVGHDGKLDDI